MKEFPLKRRLHMFVLPKHLAEASFGQFRKAANVSFSPVIAAVTHLLKGKP